MLTYTDLPLLPTQVIGSHGVSSWLWVVRDAIAEGKLGPADIAESLRDAVNVTLLDMTEAGVDIISDGEMLRADFTWHFHDRIAGLEKVAFERRLGYPGPDQLDAFRCVAPLTVPNGYGIVRRSNTCGPARASRSSPPYRARSPRRSGSHPGTSTATIRRPDDGMEPVPAGATTLSTPPARTPLRGERGRGRVSRDRRRPSGSPRRSSAPTRAKACAGAWGSREETDCLFRRCLPVPEDENIRW